MLSAAASRFAGSAVPGGINVVLADALAPIVPSQRSRQDHGDWPDGPRPCGRS